MSNDMIRVIVRAPATNIYVYNLAITRRFTYMVQAVAQLARAMSAALHGAVTQCQTLIEDFGNYLRSTSEESAMKSNCDHSGRAGPRAGNDVALSEASFQDKLTQTSLITLTELDVVSSKV